MITQDQLLVGTVGECKLASPLLDMGTFQYADDCCRVRYQLKVPEATDAVEPLTFEQAGPREKIFFDPRKTTAAIVTCGGLSPGLNNVIRSVYLELTFRYGVKRVLGIRNGYLGLNPESGLEPLELSAEFVNRIHQQGGTRLGTSRGPQDPRVTVEFLERQNIDILFCVGGDGTQRGAHAIYQEITRRGLCKSVVGVPKTIDNDIPYVFVTFGYATALEKAAEVLRGAHTEACSAPNGIGLVKLMGRDAGFIAAGAALANQDANFVLVPEVPFPIEGENGFLAALERRILKRNHALVVVAEGAGQHLFADAVDQKDASGNIQRHDIGPFLKQLIVSHFQGRGIPVNLKYIDPSYFIRSVPANAYDRILSDQMARYAVHAAMAGKTDTLIGLWNSDFLHVPISAVVAEKKTMDVTGDLWNAVLSATGQPDW